MRKIYIDLGAYDGDTVIEFLERKDAAEFEIYAFEPNPDMFRKLVKFDKGNVYISDEAAWIKEEKRELAVDVTSDSPMGSSLMSGKREIWQTMPHIQVQCFDFSEWIKQFAGQYVIVKMDVEGAEFPILEKMIEDGTITIPNELRVEFHQGKVEPYTTEYKDNLVERIQSLGVELEEWR